MSTFIHVCVLNIQKQLSEVSKVFDIIPGRCHKKFKKFKRNPMRKLTLSVLDQWMKSQLNNILKNNWYIAYVHVTMMQFIINMTNIYISRHICHNICIGYVWSQNPHKVQSVNQNLATTRDSC